MALRVIADIQGNLLDGEIALQEQIFCSSDSKICHVFQKILPGGFFELLAEIIGTDAILDRKLLKAHILVEMIGHIVDDLMNSVVSAA